MHTNPFRLIPLMSLVLLGLAVTDTHAYLDPGTGSFIFQFLIAGIMGALFGLKMFWGRISTFFKGLFSRDKK